MTDVNTITGLVEGLEGRGVVGWALDTATPAPCRIVVADAAGQVLAEGLAQGARADLALYGFGRTGLGFRVVVEALPPEGGLHVYADGAELEGSPLEVGPGAFDGVVSVAGGVVEGWVQARAPAGGAVAVVLLDQDGEVLGEVEAVAAAAAADGFAPARFRLALGAAVLLHTELAVRACVGGRVFAAAATTVTIRGELARAGVDGCAGWVKCLEMPGLALPVELRVDGVLVGEALADRPVEALRAPFPDSFSAGFEFALEPPVHRAPGPVQVSLRVAGCAAELFGGPLLVGDAGGFIAAGRRLARLAYTDSGLDAVEAAVLQAAVQDYLTAWRGGRGPQAKPAVGLPVAASVRFTVAIPVYRGVEVTRDCIDSVLAHRDAETDAVLLIDDGSPEPGMAPLLAGYAGLANVTVLTNARNRGFVATANRALGFCRVGDVILLNSDTLVHAGGLDALWRGAHAAPDIGTATGISNNATIFSYPFIERGVERLDDMDWAGVAAAALAGSAGLTIDVPTGHGFCLLLRRTLLDRVGLLDEAFGRGYGEENDLCLRGLDAGLRSVAVPGCFVEHRESVSFGEEKAALIARNTVLLEGRYPEYAAEVRGFIAGDGMRAGRWAIDTARLAAAGRRHVLVLGNWLLGGSQRAIDDIAALVGYGDAVPLHLGVTKDGRVELVSAEPAVRAVFLPGEMEALFGMLSGLQVEAVLIHQLLGHAAGFVEHLEAWSRTLRRIYYVHDFYPVCPRVVLIDAAGEFCGVPDAAVCERCIALSGVHDAARMGGRTVAEHRAVFGKLLGGMDRVIAPSEDCARWLARGLPDVAVTVVPHPEPAGVFDVPGPASIGPDVVLLGALGAHKGSAVLVEVARAAMLAAPSLRFHVVGETHHDEELHAIGNVRVWGRYLPEELADKVRRTGASMALFLSQCPETYSYTLSEAVGLGLVPLVPDLGAPADRVRAAGFGVVFGFPVRPGEVVAALEGLRTGTVSAGVNGPSGFAAPLHETYARRDPLRA